MFGFGKSSSADKDEELHRTQRAAAKLMIQDGRTQLRKSMETLQAQQKFYYVGIAYHAGTVVVASTLGHLLRSKVPIVQNVPFIVFPIAGYFGGGQLWQVHQNIFAERCVSLIDNLKDEMRTMHEKFPHLSEYRSEVSDLDKIRRQLRPNDVEGGHSHRPSGVSLEQEVDDIVSQVMSRNKVMNVNGTK
eukprot:PhM_4_TR18248/c0_g1_i1/m.80333